MSDYDLSSLHVLIADDYEPMRTILRGILRELGIKAVAEASSGAAALEKLKESGIDLVIMDYCMTPTDGIDFTRRIRKGIKGVDPFIPIILVTAYTEIKNILDARDAGVTEFLAKPISAKLVYYRIRSVIENPRPYVHSEIYVGPDRRRRRLTVNGPERRGGRESDGADTGASGNAGRSEARMPPGAGGAT